MLCVYIKYIASFFTLVNPLGTMPIFLSMTQGADDATTNKLAQRVATNCLFLLLGAVFVGSYVLAFFGLSLPIVRVAGGLLVAATGWHLLHDNGSEHGDSAIRTTLSEADTVNWSEGELRQRSFYPITFPLTVGPGSIAASIALGAQQHGKVLDWVISGSAAALTGFCAGIQHNSPVDSFASPEPADEPGYTDKVVMASGSFTEGSTIEISCDGPLRAPYTCYLQGGVNFTAGRAAVLNAVQNAFFAE